MGERTKYEKIYGNHYEMGDDVAGSLRGSDNPRL